MKAGEIAFAMFEIGLHVFFFNSRLKRCSRGKKDKEYQGTYH